MNYIKDTHVGNSFDVELSQVFTNKPSLMVEEKNIIKLRSDRQISDIEMEMIRFLFSHRFATVDVFFKFLGGRMTADEIKKSLSKLTKNRVVNSFTLIDTEGQGPGKRVKIPKNALLIYCLDVGGKVLVEHFHQADTTAWFTTETMRGVEKVAKDLTNNTFLSALINDCDFDKNKGNYFESNPVFSLGKMRVSPSFEMKIMISDTDYRYYIGEVVKRFDMPLDFRNHLSKLDSILSTNAWKKHFYNQEKAPTVLFICEDDEHAGEVATMISNLSTIDPEVGFRITTEERMASGLGEKGAFLAFNPTNNTFSEKTMGAFRK